MGEAKRRKRLDPNYGKPRPDKEGRKEQKGFPLFSLEEGMEEADLGSEEYKHKYEATGIYAEMKERGMTLSEFKEKFSEALDVIRVEQMIKVSVRVGIGTSKYEGLGLIIKHKFKGYFERFPFPDAENPDAKVPSEVFDYLCYEGVVLEEWALD